MNLKEAQEGKEYIIKGGCVVAIKDGRYNIDNQLAEAILI